MFFFLGGFKPMLTITLLTESAVAGVVSRTAIAEFRRGRKRPKPATRLLRTLAQQGYHSYRLGIQGMEQMSGAEGYVHLYAS